MPTQVQFRRGTTAQNNSFTGAAGELSVNTSNNTIRVHDGSTTGGFELAKVSDVNTAVANLIDSAPGALDTLNELAAAINDDNNFAATIVTQLGTKANTASLTTANVSEVTNLYFTNSRAILAEIPAVTQLAVTASGSSAYLIDSYSGSNPTIFVTAGETISFDLNISGHPFMIRVSSGGENYSTGLTHVATDGTVTTGSDALSKVSGKLFWKVPYSLAGSTYVYQCSSHAGMVGNIVLQKPVSTVTTTDISEGNNLYFTNTRVYSNVITIGYATNANVALKANITDLTTANVIEVSNLYFTNARARAALSAGDGTIVYDPSTGQIRATANITATIENTVNNLTTADVTETAGNLYFTVARANTAIDDRVTKTFIDNLNVDADTLDGNDSLYFAPIASPNFTGTPLSPTASAGTNTTQIATTAFVRTEVTNLIASAPATLDTLNEIAAALGNDNNFSATIITQLGNKANTASLTTANVIELNSLYFTEARARQAISSSGCTLSYSNTTGIISFSQGNTDTVAEGSTNLYYTNARVFSAVTGNLALKANLTDKLNVFAATSSAELRSVISDETGTGSLVFSASPTFTGTLNAAEISASGNVTSPFFYSQSDINLKKDIEPIVNALDIVKQLSGYSFKWKHNDAASIGLIAQYIEQVLPMLIGTTPDGSKTVLYNGIIALLLEAIKAQQVQIDEIKSKLDE